MDVGQLGRGEGLRESSPEAPWSCRGWDGLPRGEHGKTAPAPVPPAGWRGPLCGCRTETSGCPSAFSSESRAAGLSCVFMLEVGPKGVESALLTHTTVCGLWEFITGEVFHEQKGCFSSKTWWVCFCKYVDAASLVNNLATLLPTRRL